MSLKTIHIHIAGVNFEEGCKERIDSSPNESSVEHNFFKDNQVVVVDAQTRTEELNRTNQQSISSETVVAAEESINNSKFSRNLRHKIPSLGEIKNHSSKALKSTINSIEQQSPLPCSAHYANLSLTQLEYQYPEAKSLFVTVMENIIFRESFMLKMLKIAERLDNHYWKYCFVRIRAVQLKKSVNSEYLVAKRKTLRQLQKELAVSLAHVRGCSIAVITAIIKWRKESSKHSKSSRILSVFWEKKNYMLSIFEDLKKLSSISTIQIWLGFSLESNPFLLPPVNHDPRAIWEAQRKVFTKWRLRHQARISAIRRGFAFADNRVEMAEQVGVSGGSGMSSVVAGGRPNRDLVTGGFIISHSAPCVVPATHFSRPGQLSGEGDETQSSGAGAGAVADAEVCGGLGAELVGEMLASGATVEAEVCTDEKYSSSGSDREWSEQRSEEDRPASARTSTPLAVHPSDLQPHATSPALPPILPIPRHSPKEGASHHSDAHLPQISTRVDNANSNAPLVILPTTANEIVPINTAPDQSHHNDGTLLHAVAGLDPDTEEAGTDDFPFDHSMESLADSEDLFAAGEWRALREYCRPAFAFPLPFAGAAGMEVSTAKDFWSDLLHNPLVVEAAVGFADVFPEVFLVPPVPADLRNSCASLEKVLVNERKVYLELEREAERSKQLEMRVRVTANPAVLEHIAGGGRHQQIQTALHEMRRRQESDSGSLTREAEALRKGGAASSLLPPELPTKEPSGIFSMTAAVSRIEPMVVGRPLPGCGLPEGLGVGLRGDLTVVSDCQVRPLALRPEALASVAQARVEDQRRVTTTTTRAAMLLTSSGGDFEVKLRSDLPRAARPMDHTGHRWKAHCASILEALIRGFLVRFRIRKAKRKLLLELGVGVAQRIVRGFLGRRKFRRMWRQYRTENLILRKLVLRRHHAACAISMWFSRTLARLREKKKISIAIEIQRRKQACRRTARAMGAQYSALTRAIVSPSSPPLSGNSNRNSIGFSIDQLYSHHITAEEILAMASRAIESSAAAQVPDSGSVVELVDGTSASCASRADLFSHESRSTPILFFDGGQSVGSEICEPKVDTNRSSSTAASGGGSTARSDVAMKSQLKGAELDQNQEHEHEQDESIAESKDQGTNVLHRQHHQQQHHSTRSALLDTVRSSRLLPQRSGPAGASNSDAGEERKRTFFAAPTNRAFIIPGDGFRTPQSVIADPSQAYLPPHHNDPSARKVRVDKPGGQNSRGGLHGSASEGVLPRVKYPQQNDPSAQMTRKSAVVVREALEEIGLKNALRESIFGAR